MPTFFNINWLPVCRPASFLSIVLNLLLIITTSSTSAMAETSSKYWGVDNPNSTLTINHNVWQSLLNEYVVSIPEGNRFRYHHVNQSDMDKLNEYIQTLSSLDPRTYSKKEQKAYWINLYNALTIRLVLEDYPVKSITAIGPWYHSGPWDTEIVEITGRKLTLNDIEKKILSPIWEDYRVIYGLNKASLGSPDLSPTAFSAKNTDQMLDNLARRFINQEKGVSWVDGRLTLSRLYEWNEKEFIDKEMVVLHIRQYSPPQISYQLKKYAGVIQYQYNWRLNEQK